MKAIRIPSIVKNYLLDEYNGDDAFGIRVCRIASKGIIDKIDIKFITETIIGTDAGPGGVLQTLLEDTYDNPSLKAKTYRQLKALRNFIKRCKE